MYVSDAHADELVARNEVLQDVVQGKRVAFWLPGYGAGAGVIIGLLFGWTGPAIVANKIFFPPRTAWFLLGAFSAASIISLCAYRVLRGYPKARTRMNQLSTAVLAFAVAVFVTTAGSLLSAATHFREVSLQGGDCLFSVIGVAASVLAKHLVAGPFYATFAAFFRAKRAHAVHVQDQIQTVRGKHARNQRR